MICLRTGDNRNHMHRIDLLDSSGYKGKRNNSYANHLVLQELCRYNFDKDKIRKILEKEVNLLINYTLN